MRKILVITLATLLLFGFLDLLSGSASAAEQPRYGYSLLTNDVQRTAYQEFLAGVKALDARISFSADATQATMQAVSEEIKQAIKMVIKDWPELFWFSGAYGMTGEGTVDDVTIFVTPEYKFMEATVSAGSAQVATANSQLWQAVDAAIATIPQNPSDYEIALALHDYIIDHVTYEKVGEHQTAYGALVAGKAVCAGYARAYQLLMLQAGIPCTYIQGTSVDPDTKTVVNHAWNLVWLDGKCYYTDVTWDDQGVNGVFHEYLNMSKEEISSTHFLAEGEVLPGSCGHDNYRFFINNAGKGICDIRDSMSDDAVAACFQLKSLEGREATYYCTIHYHGNDFGNWFAEHYQAISEKLGYQISSCDRIDLGHESHLTITGTLADNTPLPSVAPTESTSTGQTQATQSTQQTTQSTQTGSQPTQAGSTQAATTATSQATDGAGNTAPTNPTDTGSSSTPTDPTEPAEPTGPSQESQTGASEDQPQEPSSSQTLASNDTQPDTGTKEPDQDKNDSIIIYVAIGGFVLAGGVTGSVLYFINRRRKS